MGVATDVWSALLFEASIDLFLVTSFCVVVILVIVLVVVVLADLDGLLLSSLDFLLVDTVFAGGVSSSLLSLLSSDDSANLF